jgi:hypothetical protein
LPPRTAALWPFVDMRALDDHAIPPRTIRSPVPAAEFKRMVLGFADDVGLVRADHPALAHELDEVRWV